MFRILPLTAMVVLLGLALLAWFSEAPVRLSRQTAVSRLKTLHPLQNDKTQNQNRQNILLTSYVSSQTCDEACQSTQKALRAFTQCSARKIGFEPMVVTQIPHSNGIKSRGWTGPGPFPHFMKIHIIENLFHSRSDAVDWVLWVDADVRIVNLTYPVQSIIEYAERMEANVIAMAQYSYDTYINDIFMIRNGIWGKRFVHVWKTLILNGGSCGFFDQCPFGVAMVQIQQDSERWGGNITDASIHATVNITLEKMALRHDINVQDTILKLELQRVTGSGSGANRTGPANFGPILLLPAWTSLRSNDSRSELPWSSLTVEPTRRFMKETMERNEQWPLAVHTKYSKFFCNGVVKRNNDSVNQMYEKMLQNFCTDDEKKQMGNPDAQCWTRWTM